MCLIAVARPAMTDLMAGQVQVVFNPVPESMEFIRSGKPPPLAVTTATRSEVLPDVSTVGDFVPGYEGSALQGIGAPKKTPAEIVEKLNNEINAALVDPTMRARLADLGGTPLPGSQAQFGKLIAEETEKMGQGDPSRQHQAAGMKSRPKIGKTFHSVPFGESRQ